MQGKQRRNCERGRANPRIIVKRTHQDDKQQYAKDHSGPGPKARGCMLTRPSRNKHSESKCSQCTGYRQRLGPRTQQVQNGDRIARRRVRHDRFRDPFGPQRSAQRIEQNVMGNEADENGKRRVFDCLVAVFHAAPPSSSPEGNPLRDMARDRHGHIAHCQPVFAPAGDHSSTVEHIVVRGLNSSQNLLGIRRMPP